MNFIIKSDIRVYTILSFRCITFLHLFFNIEFPNIEFH